MGLNYRQQRSLAESVDHVLDPPARAEDLQEGYRPIHETASTRIGYQIQQAFDNDTPLPASVLDYLYNTVLSEGAYSVMEMYVKSSSILLEFGHGNKAKGVTSRTPRVPTNVSPGALEPKAGTPTTKPPKSDFDNFMQDIFKKLKEFGKKALDFVVKTVSDINAWITDNILDPIIDAFPGNDDLSNDEREAYRIGLRIALAFLFSTLFGGGSGGGGGGGGQPPFGGG
jgi:hypothetical protein